jgi:hypothetical protein
MQVDALLALLDDETREKLNNRMTDSARNFTPANPTGYYRLDLLKQAEREVVLRLMEIRNSEIEEMKARPRPKGELAVNKTTVAEHHIRNASLDSNPFVFASSWRLPTRGLLSFDFTSTSKPPPGAREHAVELEPMLREIKGNEGRLQKVKEVLGSSYITLKTAKHCFMLMKGSEARVSFLVLAFARIIEWHGFHDLTSMLTKDELLHNVYDPFSSVGYWEMQLENPEHRVVAAHLVRLAVLEPGDNVEDAWSVARRDRFLQCVCVSACCRYASLPFEIPGSWCTTIPAKNFLSLFYCRLAIPLCCSCCFVKFSQRHLLQGTGHD